jgi:anthranilate phosphoribosyltransferase
MIRECTEKLISKVSLTENEVENILGEIVSGAATPAQIGAFLVALKLKPETSAEIAFFAKAMRKLCIKISPKTSGCLLDTAGTGGDRAKTFNVSTAAALLLAAGGLTVAKHGNRAVGSKSGSADVLEALGVKIDADPSTVQECVERAGIGFLFAPVFHPALKSVAQIRRELGLRTIFNLLGPLTNPAGAQRQLLGVAEPYMVQLISQALHKLGTERAYVVHGSEGLDEVSIVGSTQVAVVQNGRIEEILITPEQMGLRPAEPQELFTGSVKESALTVYRIVSGRTNQSDPKTRLVLANAGVGFVVGGLASSVKEGVAYALHVLDSGSAVNVLRSLVTLSGGNVSKLEEFEKNA